MVSIKQIKRDSAKAARAAAKVIKQRNKPVTFYGPLLPGNRYKASEVLPQRMETYISRNKRLVQMKHTKGIQYMNVPHGPFLLRVIDSKSHPHNYYNTKAASVWADHDDILPVSLGNYNKKRKIGYYNYNPYTGAEKAEIKKKSMMIQH